MLSGDRRRRLRSSVLVGVAAVLALGAAGEAWAAGTPGTGWDVPSCTQPLPTDGALAVLPVNNGVGFTANSCLGAEAAQAIGQGKTVQLFANGANPGSTSVHWPAGCADSTPSCGTAYGQALAADAINEASVGGLPAGQHFWWIDIERNNTWSGFPAVNQAVIQAMIDTLHASTGSVSGVGVYTNNTDWPTIAATTVSVPLWSASPAATQGQAAVNCTDPNVWNAITTSRVFLTQYARPDGRDGDLICPPVIDPTPSPLEGNVASVSGWALPVTTLGLRLQQPDRGAPLAVTTSDPTGRWTASLPKARYTATLTVTALTSTNSATAAVRAKTTSGYTKAVRVGSRCALRTAGTLTPAWPNQRVNLNINGRPTRITKTGRTATGVKWDQTFLVSCGRAYKTSIGTNGKGGSHGFTGYTAPFTSSVKVIRTS